jgi:two-component system phosphate regulon response regulator PhoB
MSAKILVVDDNALCRMVVSGLLKDAGHEVTTAGDGEEGLAAFRDRQFDAVLLDVQMPRLDGLALCRILKGRPETRNVPIVMLSGLATAESRSECLAAGADDFLSKPAASGELLARLNSALNSRLYAGEVA